MFYDPNQSWDNRSLRNAAPHIYKKAAEICAGEDEHKEEKEKCNRCGHDFPEDEFDFSGLCERCAEAEAEENQ